MTDRTGAESAAEQVLCHALEKLRAREGVKLIRLQAAASGAAAPLLNLAAVRRYSTDHGVDPASAAVIVVRDCVRHALDGTGRIVADAVLALGMFTDAYLRHGIEPRAVDDMRSDLLSRRRRALLTQWYHLHEAIGVRPNDVPSDRTLRGSLESAVLTDLARQLSRRIGPASSGAAGTAPRDRGGSDDAARDRSGRVIVVGGAVMDATFRTKVLPPRETSAEAHGFSLCPGGKGLTQAVAAARLGLNVSLLAAVSGDRFGEQIIDYLRRENVDTSLLKVVPDTETPFTGIFEFELGDSVAVNWRNEREVRLALRDVDRAASRLQDSDAVLLTFEVPRESMQHAVALIHRAHHRRPIVIVTPSQPYTDGGVSAQTLAQIDYLVAHSWELGRYAPPDQQLFDIKAVARRMLAYGVEVLCIPTGGGCAIYSETPVGNFQVPTFPSIFKESSAVRDAFCAALAAKLIDEDRKFSEEVALWATGAMAAAAADHTSPDSMPDRRRVDQLLTRSRFTVAPRPKADDDLTDADGTARWDPPIQSRPGVASSR